MGDSGRDRERAREIEAWVFGWVDEIDLLRLRIAQLETDLRAAIANPFRAEIDIVERLSKTDDTIAAHEKARDLAFSERDKAVADLAEADGLLQETLDSWVVHGTYDPTKLAARIVAHLNKRHGPI